MSYRFPLQKIVDFKTGEKERKQLDLANKIAAHQAEIDRLTDLIAQEQKATSLFVQKQEAGTNIQELREVEQYVANLRRQVIVQKEAVKTASVAVEAEQEQLKDKAMEEKTWQLLKEKKKEAYEKEMKLKEEQQIEEIVQARFSREIRS